MKSFLKDSKSAIIWQLLNVILGFITGVFLARGLGVEGRGEYAMISLNVLLFSLVALLGLEASLIYFMGKKEYTLNVLFSTCIFFTLINSLFLSVLVVSLEYLGIYIFGGELSLTMLSLVVFAIISEAIITIIRQFFLGEKKVALYNKLLVSKSIIFFVFLIMLYATGYLNLILVVSIYLLSNIFVLFYGIIELKEIRVSTKYFDKHLIVELLKYGFYFFLTGLGSFLISRLNFWILEYYQSVKIVGIYSVAMIIPNFIAIIPTQAGVILFPYVSDVDKREESLGLTTMVLKHTIFWGILGASSLFIVGNLVITIVYGDAYSDATSPMIVLAYSMVIMGIYGVLYNYLAGLGKAIYGLYGTIIMLVSLFASSYFLTSIYGLMGAAYSQLISSIVVTLFLSIIFWYQTKIPISQWLFLSRKDFEIYIKFIKNKLN
jgi:O-antigen/teichoic acid export membrane protein